MKELEIGDKVTWWYFGDQTSVLRYGIVKKINRVTANVEMYKHDKKSVVPPRIKKVNLSALRNQ